MSRLEVGKRYCLRLPDGGPVGHLQIAWIDPYWAGGPFAEGPAFGDLRQLFKREAELRRDQIIPLWEKAADAIDDLHVQVVEEEGAAVHSGFRIRVDGNEASLGFPQDEDHENHARQR